MDQWLILTTCSKVGESIKRPKTEQSEGAQVNAFGASALPIDTCAQVKNQAKNAEPRTVTLKPSKARVAGRLEMTKPWKCRMFLYPYKLRLCARILIYITGHLHRIFFDNLTPSFSNSLIAFVYASKFFRSLWINRYEFLCINQ